MSTTTEQRTSVTVAEHVATVTMTRPERHNALDEHMFRGLHAAIEQVGGDPSVRVVVLCGEGPSFCSGLDVPSFMTGEGMGIEDVLARRPDADANFAQGVATGWMDLAVPVIAALQGAVFGGGIQIALGADVRVSAPDARLCVMESKWGLIPDMAITRTLTRLVPIDVAKALTFGARTVSGEEALALGLVTEVSDDPLARAHELAAGWAQRSPGAIQGAKRLYDEAWTMDRADSLLLEERLQRELMGSPNQLEAIRAGLAKETPTFT